MKYLCLIIFIGFSSTIFSQPVITSFSPTSAGVGSSVIIKGFGFDTSAAGNIVYFGAVRGTVTSATDSSIVAIVPYGATHSLITVNSRNLVAYSSKKFFFTTGIDTTFTSTTFTERQDYRAGDYASSVAIADFDGDGKADVAVGHYSDATISVFRNTSVKPVISLSAKITVSTPPGPGDLAVADIDGDRKPDLVTANGSSQTIAIFLNTSANGVISFAPAKQFAAGTFAVGVAVGDIDGDGKPDILQTNNQDRTVSVLRNTGSVGVISFASRITFPTGLAPASVAVMDMDGDGKLDVCVENMYSHSVSLYKNTSVRGIISLNAGIDFPTDSIPSSMDIGDLDNDGKPDIVTGNSGRNTISVLKNRSTGSVFDFSRQDITVGTIVKGVAINEVDGDGRLDVAIAGNGNQISIAVLKNISSIGTISFAPKVDYQLQGGLQAITIADLDNDAKNDIIIGDGSTLSTLRNRMFEPVITSPLTIAGSYGTVVTIKGASFTGVTSVFFGSLPAISFIIVNDSTITAVVGYGATGVVKLVNAYGTSAVNAYFSYNPRTPVITSVTPNAAHVHTSVTIRGQRFGNDPINRYVYFGAVPASIISANDSVINAEVPVGATFAPVSVTREKLTAYSPKPFNVTFDGSNGAFSTNTFGTQMDSATGTRPEGIATGDFDRDGKPDIVIANYDGSDVFVHQNLSDSVRLAFSWRFSLQWGLNPQDVTVADLDGDGQLDLAVPNRGSNIVALYKNYTSAYTLFGLLQSVNTPAEPSVVKVADLNADGRPELVVLCKTGVRTFLNASTETFLSFLLPFDSTLTGVPKDLVIADFDGDGKPDLAISDSTSGSVTIFRNTTTSQQIRYAARQQFVSGHNAGLALADMDGDDRIDLVVANPSDNRITILRNESISGNIGFSTQYFPTSFPALSVSIVDIDGDGKPDVGYSVPGANGISILRNSSGASVSFNSDQQISTKDKAHDVAFADLDGDSKPELIASLPDKNRYAVFRNQTGEIIKATTCPGGDISLTSNIQGSAYHWQADTGAGFVDIIDTGHYSGTNSLTLQLHHLPSSWYGFKYRCLVGNAASEVFSLKFQNIWTSSTNDDWEEATKWSCGSLPDATTDVVIASGDVRINSNVVVRSMKVNPGSSLTVAPGFTLTITN